MGLPMSSNGPSSLVVNSVGKAYEIYDSSWDRLRQLIWGRKGRKFYREFVALRSISFELARGESMGVIGRNGAGKSTLLQIITGTLAPTTGFIKAHGRIAAVLELGAGFNTEFTGRENIDLYCRLFEMNSAAIAQRMPLIIEFSELGEFIDQPIKTYSSGMVARLAFSVIAHVDADTLIIDEALSVGDVAFSMKCMRFLEEFKRRGSIFFVSHDISAVRRFCDRALWLDGGNVRALGEVGQVCDLYLAEAYPQANQGQSDAKLLTNDAQQEMLQGRSESIEALPGSDDPPVAGLRIRDFRFNPGSTSFGIGSAAITGVVLRSTDGKPLVECKAQAVVEVVVRAQTEREVQRPILGFFVKDRLGQALFGANTYARYAAAPLVVRPGRVFEAVFRFQMPTLLPGSYSMTAALAAGTLSHHVQLHWMHDACLFEVTESSADGVLVGIPMQTIEMYYAAS